MKSFSLGNMCRLILLGLLIVLAIITPLILDEWRSWENQRSLSEVPGTLSGTMYHAAAELHDRIVPVGPVISRDPYCLTVWYHPPEDAGERPGFTSPSHLVMSIPNRSVVRRVVLVDDMCGYLPAADIKEMMSWPQVEWVGVESLGWSKGNILQGVHRSSFDDVAPLLERMIQLRTTRCNLGCDELDEIWRTFREMRDRGRWVCYKQSWLKLGITREYVPFTR